MAWVYWVQAFEKNGRRLTAKEPIEAADEAEAIRVASRLAARGGAVAGAASEADLVVTLARFGEVPV